MIEQLIKQRMEIAGVTQGQLAEVSGCTPSQMGLFLKGKASLNRESMDKCIQYVGIDLSIQLKRVETAQLVAKKLKNIKTSEIEKMTQEEMAEKTGVSSILVLPNVGYDKFIEMVKSGIVDYESTFPYFKSLVLHFSNIGEKATVKSVETSFNSILELVPFVKGVSLSLLGLAGATIGTFLSPLSIAMNKLFEKDVFPKSTINAWTPLLTITYSLLEGKLKKKERDTK